MWYTLEKSMAAILPYQQAPEAIRRAKLDNIALVPASLLSLKSTYQPIANNLPTGSVLICATNTTRSVKTVLESVATYFRTHGHTVYTLPLEKIARKGARPRPTAENLKLAI